MSAGQTGDARLLRRVRWQLVAWSGGVVLVVLVALGVVLSFAVARSLEANGIAQLEERANGLGRFIADDDPARPLGPGRPPVGISFGGRSSGTFAFVVPPGGEVLGPAGLQLPAGLPDTAAVEAARASGTSDIRVLRRPATRQSGS